MSEVIHRRGMIDVEVDSIQMCSINGTGMRRDPPDHGMGRAKGLASHQIEFRIDSINCYRPLVVLSNEYSPSADLFWPVRWQTNAHVTIASNKLAF